MHTLLGEAERRAILQWLSPIAVQQQHATSLASLLPGTGHWLLENPSFVSWKTSSASEKFWLHGIRELSQSYQL